MSSQTVLQRELDLGQWRLTDSQLNPSHYSVSSPAPVDAPGIAHGV